MILFLEKDCQFIWFYLVIHHHLTTSTNIIQNPLTSNSIHQHLPTCQSHKYYYSTELLQDICSTYGFQMFHYAKVKETAITFNFNSTHDMFHHIQDKWLPFHWSYTANMLHHVPVKDTEILLNFNFKCSTMHKLKPFNFYSTYGLLCSR